MTFQGAFRSKYFVRPFFWLEFRCFEQIATPLRVSTIMKTLGVLTSGGAAPGITPALRSIARTAMEHKCRAVGINNG